MNRAVPSIRVTFSGPVARYSRPPASDRVDPTEDAVADRRPVGTVELGVDPELAAVRASTALSAGSTNILDGMQPTFRQVPPNVPRSTIAIFQSDRYSGIEFPDPLPMMIRSYCSAFSWTRCTATVNTVAPGSVPVATSGRWVVRLVPTSPVAWPA